MHATEPSPALDARFHALAHPARREILRLVRESERTAGEIAYCLGMSGPATSQHLKALREADLVAVQPRATQRLYRVDPEGIADVRAFLEDFWGDRLARLKAGAEAMAHREREDCSEAG